MLSGPITSIRVRFHNVHCIRENGRTRRDGPWGGSERESEETKQPLRQSSFGIIVRVVEIRASGRDRWVGYPLR